MINKIKHNIGVALPYVAVFGAMGVAVYAFSKTYKAIKELGEFPLDFGNDESLSKHFNKDQ